MPLKSKLKKTPVVPQQTLWEWIGWSVWSQSQQEFAGKHSCSLEEPPKKALTGDCGANRWMGWPAKEMNSGITTLFLLVSGNK